MMTANKFPFYWRSNKEWFNFDKNDRAYLTDKAPEEAKKSFEEYKKLVKKRDEHNV